LILTYTVDEETYNRTVKHILKNRLGLSERLIKRLKYAGKVFRNSCPVHVNETVKLGDVISVTIDFEEECEDVIPEEIDIDIIYEDECLIVINKQPNIVVHPTCSHPTGTIANAVMHHLISKGVKRKIRPVSRLDRDTSGIIIFAKNQFAQEFLIRQMGSTFKKEYAGVVHGIVEKPKGTINLPIERKPGSIMLRQVSHTGAPSVTHYEVIEYLNNATFLSFNLETGRTHQIRVHCQAIGHPLVGDTLYGSETGPDGVFPKDIINRQALHSYKVSFIHPFTRTLIELTAPIPQDILKVLEILRK